ncbi:MAG: nucleotidyl transferase AbiEii/AbiGii toxin family protein, partial [Streptosporangiaceae bacterium]
MSTGLGREEIRVLLDDLSAELAARGARAELFLVGGAALAVAYDATRATRDLDAVFVPAGIVRQAARAVAERRGLTEDWLNDAVKGFLPGTDPDAQRFYSSDSLIVDVASP